MKIELKEALLKKCFRPHHLAERYGVNLSKILDFIKTGQLVAIDISFKRGERGRYVITPEAVQAFERSRMSVQVPEPKQPRRRPREPADADYY
jgi:hypothetical protein